MLSPAEPCGELSAADTWNGRVPTGYLYGIGWLRTLWYPTETWNSLQCTQTFTRSVRAYEKCLKSKPLIIVGDSTVRQFFRGILDYLDLDLKEGINADMITKAWHKVAHATSKERDISLEWWPHEHPFCGAGSRRSMRSIASLISDIGANSTAIILVHWYLHFAVYLDHNTYREHVRNAKVAIQKLVKRSPEVKIFIKGPHATREKISLVPYDFVARYMEQVLYEEFPDMQNTVYYLNVWDITVGSENCPTHQTGQINRIMIHNFLSLTCKTF